MEIRDPIHGFIQPEGIEIELLDSMPVQRLRGIKQLALASLVYPGAHHTRFEHSLGTMHVADRMARAIGIPEERRRVLRLATLLHDVGHGPFSHVAEQLLERFGAQNLIHEANVDSFHERITLDVIRRDRGIRRALGSRLDSVIGLIQKSDTGSAERDIISGPMDADKLDYLLRDTYFAGVKYGVVDLDRIINTLDVVRAGRNESHLVVSEGGAWAISQLLLAKHHMTVQVYKHRARAITDAMIVRAVELAVQERLAGVREVFAYDGSPVALDRYLACDDHRLLRMILEGRGARCSKEYCKRLLGRSLLKEVFRKNIGEIENALATNKLLRLSHDEVLLLERRIGRLLQRHPAMVILDVQDILNPTYRSPGFEIHEDDIMVKRRDGAIVKIQALPDVVTVPKEKKQTHVSVYSERDGVAPRPSDRSRKRLEGQILEILEQIAR